MTTAAAQKPICVPLDKRDRNDVDARLEQIASDKKRVEDIQLKCQHDYRLIQEPVYESSLVVGFYKLATSSTDSYLLRFNVRCLVCSHDHFFRVDQKCPRCFGSMICKVSSCGMGVGLAVAYFGTHEMLPAQIAVHECESCEFKIVTSEPLEFFDS